MSTGRCQFKFAGQAGNTNLGCKTLLNGTLVSNIVIDTSQVATDTIDYVRYRPKRPHLNLNKNCPHRACHVICRRRHDNSRNLDRSVEPRGSAGNRAHTSRLVQGIQKSAIIQARIGVIEECRVNCRGVLNRLF